MRQELIARDSAAFATKTDQLFARGLAGTLSPEDRAYINRVIEEDQKVE